MNFSIRPKSDQTLLLQQNTDYSLGVAFLVLALVFALMAPFSEAPLFLLVIFLGGSAVASLVFFFNERELTCTLDKGTGMIVYQRGGAFGTHYNRQEAQYAWQDIQALAIKQYIQRSDDLFQLRLILQSGQQLNLSAARLKFSEAQSLAQQIQQFMGSEIPLQSVDW